jgi:hypothetical protein
MRGERLMHRQDEASAAHRRLRKREALSLFAKDLLDHTVAAAAKWSKQSTIGITKPRASGTTFHVVCLPQYLEHNQRTNSPLIASQIESPRIAYLAVVPL